MSASDIINKESGKLPLVNTVRNRPKSAEHQTEISVASKPVQKKKKNKIP
jgi:hypothetical protein